MKRSPETKRIRRIYEKHPYPGADGRARRYISWDFAPLEWIHALWKPGRKASIPERILIAGCGTGAEAFAMQRRFPQATVVGIDFSPRSIAIARQLRSPKLRRIRFLLADLASQKLRAQTSGDFDFISCHGVLSYVPAPERVLRNLARCLKPDGALYLGVNGARHFSVNLRQLLPGFGFDISEMRDSRPLRDLLKLCDAMERRHGAGRVARFKPTWLASDLFGPLIMNFSLADWVQIAREAGLHLRGDYAFHEMLRAVSESAVCRVLMPKSRAEICAVADILSPAAFHRLLFTRQPELNPPWEKLDILLTWRPFLTGLYESRLPKRAPSWRAFRKVIFKSSATNTRIDWQMPEWELEILRHGDGQRTLAQLLTRIPITVPRQLLREQLYMLHQLLVLTLEPGSDRLQRTTLA